MEQCYLECSLQLLLLEASAPSRRLLADCSLSSTLPEDLIDFRAFDTKILLTSSEIDKIKYLLFYGRTTFMDVVRVRTTAVSVPAGRAICLE